MSNPPSIEVTKSEFQDTIQAKKNRERNKRRSHKNMTRKSWGLLSPSRKKKDSDSVSSKHSISGFSSVGAQSVAGITVNSGTTIKASNLQQEQIELKLATDPSLGATDSNGNRQENQKSPKRNSSSSHRPPKPWKSLKRLVSKGRHSKQQQQQIASINSQSSSDLADAGNAIQRRHAKSHDGAEFFSSAKLPLDNNFPIRKRFHSDGVASASRQDGIDSVPSTESQHEMDLVIRGRLDGIDVMSLGPAGRTLISFEPSSKPNDKRDTSEQDRKSNKTDENDTFSFNPINSSFVKLQSPSPPAKIIDEVIWMSAGTDHAEIIFEGFYPGFNNRWGVRIAAMSSQSQTSLENQKAMDPKDDRDGCISPLACNLNTVKTDSDESTASTTTDNDGSTKLWNNIWGPVDTPPPIPSYMQIISPEKKLDNTAAISNEGEDDQQFVDMCNVPVDLDEDAFMVNCPQHVNSIHDVVMVALQARRFDSAISILEKLLRGLYGSQDDLHLVASTSHNIGMSQLCLRKYEEALRSFQRAVEIRKECLPDGHPDIAVSLQREGMAYFALGSMSEALNSFEAALALCTSMDNTYAKLLNNIGVARYQLKEYSLALESFESALQIQRPWLEGSVRRETIVYSASTILSNIGKVHLRQGKHDLAYEVFEEACLIQTSIFRMDHKIVLRSMDNMARAQAMNQNYSEALKIFTSLHRSQTSKFGPDSESCIQTLEMMGMCHFKLTDYEEAEKCMREVETWQTHKGGIEASHPLVRITSDRLEQIKRCLDGKETVWV